MNMCVYVCACVCRKQRTLGVLFYLSPSYSFEVGSPLETVLGYKPASPSKPLTSTHKVLGLQAEIQPHPNLVSNKVESEDQHLRLSSGLHTCIWHTHTPTHTHECVHIHAHTSYTINLFKRQENQTSACRKDPKCHTRNYSLGRWSRWFGGGGNERDPPAQGRRR